MNSGDRIVLGLGALMVLCRLFIPEWSEWIALALMICAGIPHGAFDLRVAELRWSSKRVSRGIIVSVYLACVVTMGALCVFMPLWGLLVFLTISAAHFSEGEATTSSWVGRYQGWLYGIGAILLPIGFHIDQAGDYLAYFISTADFSMISLYVRWLAAVVGFLITAQLLRATIVHRSWNRSDTLQRGVCLGCWLMLPPLAGFAVWFVGRHSRLHLETCAARLSDSSRRLPLDFIAISVLAILGLAPFSFMFDFSDIGQLFAAALCLIAGLTLPHMIVTYGMREHVARRSGGPEGLSE